MAGIYIHIPFCKKACHYCDFHFSTTFESYAQEMVSAIVKELRDRQHYLNEDIIETIYFGGGTPSLLSAEQINTIMDAIKSNFIIANRVEITLESNPDDLKLEKIKELTSTDINRLSIGIQSFSETDLIWMNRSHSVDQGIAAVVNAKELGFKNITIDLIYGVPGMSLERWRTNLEQLVRLKVNHVSCYALTVEKGTALDHMISKGRQLPPNENDFEAHFNLLSEYLPSKGFIQYELSNFCLPGNESKHNSNYWSGLAYLGVGPSAHSFNGIERRWNISNNRLYMQGLEANDHKFESEILTKENLENEYIMTGLRTIVGCEIAKFSRPSWDRILSEGQKYLSTGHLLIDKNHLILSLEGRKISDRIISDLFILNDKS